MIAKLRGGKVGDDAVIWHMPELAHVTCPIGIDGINDKRPEVIAVSVAAQLLRIAV